MATHYGVSKIEVGTGNDSGRIFTTIWIDECNEIPEKVYEVGFDTLFVDVAKGSDVSAEGCFMKHKGELIPVSKELYDRFKRAYDYEKRIISKEVKSIMEINCSVFPFLNHLKGIEPFEQVYMSEEEKGYFRNEAKHRISCLRAKKRRKAKRK